MSRDTNLPPPASPCKNICRLDAVRGLCEGCLRTLEEISSWSRASSEEKRVILRRIEVRSIGPSSEV
jgi:hypothetical protein